MRSPFIPVLVLVLSQSAAIALPTNSTLHFLSTRAGAAGVCAQDFRTVVASDCITVGARFTQDLADDGSGGPTVTRHDDVTDENVPAAHQCDHIIEIQTLGRLLKTRNVCAALAKLVKVTRANPSSPSIAKILSPLEEIISSQDNLFFLSENVNNRKGVLAKIGTAANAGAEPVTRAVGDYLSKTQTQALDIATQLDDAINTVITDMRAVSTANPPPAKAGRLSPADAAKRDLAQAVSPAMLEDVPTLRQTWLAFIGSFP